MINNTHQGCQLQMMENPQRPCKNLQNTSQKFAIFLKFSPIMAFIVYTKITFRDIVYKPKFTLHNQNQMEF